MAEAVSKEKKTTTVKKYKWEHKDGFGVAFHVCSNCGEAAPDLNERGTRCSRKFCPGCGKPMED